MPFCGEITMPSKQRNPMTQPVDLHYRFSRGIANRRSTRFTVKKKKISLRRNFVAHGGEKRASVCVYALYI